MNKLNQQFFEHLQCYSPLLAYLIIYISSFNPLNNPVRYAILLFFSDEVIETQRLHILFGAYS